MSGVTNGKPLQALVEIGIEDRPRHESEATERSEPGSVREARSDGTCNRAPSPASSGNERSLAIASASFSRSSLSLGRSTPFTPPALTISSRLHVSKPTALIRQSALSVHGARRSYAIEIPSSHPTQITGLACLLPEAMIRAL